MRILVYTNNTTAGEWIKETLEEFGRGMHITTRSEEDKELLKKHFSCIITLGISGKDIPDGKLHFNFPVPTSEENYALLKRNLWALYRDTLRDMIGNKCSCGLYDVCHCH